MSTELESLLLNDEDTGLMSRPTKLPWGQLSIVYCLQLSEPMVATLVYPFAAELIRDIGVTGGDETQIGYYVGLLESIFYLGQACTTLFWGALSDKIGRKPIILIGISGSVLSMYTFGFARSFPLLVLTRSLNGALNGNIGVLRSAIAEMTDDSNLAKAFSFMPVMLSGGETLGSLIGGSFARPVDRYPALFGGMELFKAYPYLLPCAIGGTFALALFITTSLRFRETLKDPKSLKEVIRSVPAANRSLSLQELLIPPVINAALNHASLALLTMAYSATRPVFFALITELGGLHLDPPAIGAILASSGILAGLASIVLFVQLHERIGTRRLYQIAIGMNGVIFATFPVMSWLVKSGSRSIALAFLVIHIFFPAVVMFGYGVVFVCLREAAPSKASLASVNGISQFGVSLMRAVAPAAANSLLSVSLKHNLLGGSLLWYILIGFSIFAVCLGSRLPLRAKVIQ